MSKHLTLVSIVQANYPLSQFTQQHIKQAGSAQDYCKIRVFGWSLADSPKGLHFSFLHSSFLLISGGIFEGHTQRLEIQGCILSHIVSV